jgi:hypothetical protein
MERSIFQTCDFYQRVGNPSRMDEIPLKPHVVGNMATAEMTQMIKVVIDGNQLFMENRDRNTEDETQTLQHQCEHRCCNTNANCCNTRLVMEHAQVLEHRS